MLIRPLLRQTRSSCRSGHVISMTGHWNCRQPGPAGAVQDSPVGRKRLRHALELLNPALADRRGIGEDPIVLGRKCVVLCRCFHALTLLPPAANKKALKLILASGPSVASRKIAVLALRHAGYDYDGDDARADAGRCRVGRRASRVAPRHPHQTLYPTCPLDRINYIGPPTAVNETLWCLPGLFWGPDASFPHTP